MNCSCVVSDNDWDEVIERCGICTCIFKKGNEKASKVKRLIETKRISFEKRRNKIFIRNFLRRLFKKIQDQIESSKELKIFIREMSSVFENVEDVIMLKYIVYSYNIKTLTDLLQIQGLYHLKIDKFLIDGRVKLEYPGVYKGELFSLEWSDQAIYLLRTLVGLTRFGEIDYGHMKAIFWKRNEEDVKSGIKRLMENDYVF